MKFLNKLERIGMESFVVFLAVLLLTASIVSLGFFGTTLLIGGILAVKNYKLWVD